MRAPLLVLALLVAAIVCAVPAFGQGGTPVAPPPPPPPPTPKLQIQKPSNKRLIREGWPNRLLLGGRWYFRLDDAFQGDRGRYAKQRSLRGWTATGVPHNWNATDTVLNRSSLGWYRKEFRLPRPPRGVRQGWKLRFEGANHRATVYLNGREIGSHAGGYLPFEVVLKGLKRRNRLVVRVSSLRASTDLTHWRRASFNGFGTGGWWNFGGLLREVYVRPVQDVDIENVAMLPGLKRVRGPATVAVRTYLRNHSRRAKRVRLVLTLDKRRQIELGTTTVRGRRAKTVRGRFRIRKPRLWQIGKGRMYAATVAAATEGRVTSRYSAAFGVRRIDRKPGGIATINGRRMNLRGASIHEDHVGRGAAWGPGQRSEAFRHLKRLHANVTRAHYPLHPAMMEKLDRAGILYWSQAPVYQVPNVNLENAAVRRAAVQANIDTVRQGINHPSIFVWSISNELEPTITGGQARFIGGAVSAVRRLDRTRLVAMDRANRVGEPEGNPVLQRLSALGMNEYFGWYRASLLPNPRTTDAGLGPYLDQIHRLYPRAAMFITEFGAEGNRNGPVSEKGTFEFQTRWTRDHLGIHASRPYINGSIAWALKDFRVNPGWNGGNPKPNPPWNNKSPIDEGGALKPVYFELQRLFGATRPTR